MEAKLRERAIETLPTEDKIDLQINAEHPKSLAINIMDGIFVTSNVVVWMVLCIRSEPPLSGCLLLLGTVGCQPKRWLHPVESRPSRPAVCFHILAAALHSCKLPIHRVAMLTHVHDMINKPPISTEIDYQCSYRGA